MQHFLRTPALAGAIASCSSLTLITGVIYPAAITAVAQVAFPNQANGSFITTPTGATVGSSLIGQAFSDPKYFWGRLSAAGADGYDANGSAGSNLGPTNQDLIERITAVGRRRCGPTNGGAPDPGRPRHDLGIGPRPATSARPRPSTRSPGWRRPGA